MIDWIMADTTAPNYAWLFMGFIGGFGLFATIQSTERLKRSSENWRNIVTMINEFHQQLEEEKNQ